MENDKEWGDAKVNRSQIQIRSVSSKCFKAFKYYMLLLKRNKDLTLQI